MANKLLRIMIEGFMGGFQIFHCGIFWGKKIWKVFFGGEGGGAVRCKYVFKGCGGVVQNNLKTGVAWHSQVCHLSKYNPDCFAVVLFTCKFSGYLSFLLFLSY